MLQTNQGHGCCEEFQVMNAVNQQFTCDFELLVIYSKVIKGGCSSHLAFMCSVFPNVRIQLNHSFSIHELILIEVDEVFK